MDLQKKKWGRLRRRRYHIRKRVYGTADRPRLSVYRSLAHIYAQIIDDDQAKTLVGLGTTDPELRKQLTAGGNIKAAEAVGEALSKKAQELGITRVVFDRGGRRYHGRVKALAEAARKGGLQF